MLSFCVATFALLALQSVNAAKCCCGENFGFDTIILSSGDALKLGDDPEEKIVVATVNKDAQILSLGGRGDDTIVGGAGNDRRELAPGGKGDDVLIGGNGLISGQVNYYDPTDPGVVRATIPYTTADLIMSTKGLCKAGYGIHLTSTGSPKSPAFKAVQVDGDLGGKVSVNGVISCEFLVPGGGNIVIHDPKKARITCITLSKDGCTTSEEGAGSVEVNGVAKFTCPI